MQQEVDLLRPEVSGPETAVAGYNPAWRAAAAEQLTDRRRSVRDWPSERDIWVRLQADYTRRNDRDEYRQLHYRARMDGRQCNTRRALIWANRLASESIHHSVRLRVEAALLCPGAHFKHVAALIGIPTIVVQAFSRIFFDVSSPTGEGYLLSMAQRLQVAGDATAHASHIRLRKDNPAYWKHVAMTFGIRGLIAIWRAKGLLPEFDEDGYIINFYRDNIEDTIKRWNEAQHAGLIEVSHAPHILRGMEGALAILRNPRSLAIGAEDSHDDPQAELLNLLEKLVTPTVQDRIAEDPDVVATQISAKLSMMIAMDSRARDSLSLAAMDSRMKGGK